MLIKKLILAAAVLLVTTTSTAQEIPHKLLKGKLELTSDNVKLYRWNKEANIEIISPLKTSLSKLGNKWSQENSDIKVRMYELQSDNDQLEEGGFEYEVILKKKPLTNRVSLKIKTKELVFYYQPSLEQWEIDEGAFRPENVIGSYAVYHATKKDHIFGKTNYKTGKAFHIYRPKIIDADGKWVWGKFNKDLGQAKVLTITIPQNFLDSAKYPVIVDPTFGYTTIGATWDTREDKISSYRFTMGATAGTADSITTYVSVTTVDKKAKLAVYLQSDDTLTFSSAENTLLAADAAHWETFTVSGSPSLSASTDYILADWGEFGDGYNSSKYDTGTAGYQYYQAVTYTGTYPDPWTGYGTGNRIKSIYVTYTETGGTVRSDVFNTGIGGGIGRGIR